jgi:hypothetical protein
LSRTQEDLPSPSLNEARAPSEKARSSWRLFEVIRNDDEGGARTFIITALTDQHGERIQRHRVHARQDEERQVERRVLPFDEVLKEAGTGNGKLVGLRLLASRPCWWAPPQGRQMPALRLSCTCETVPANLQ